MKQPVWILNLSLFALLLVLVILISLYKVKLPPVYSIIPDEITGKIIQQKFGSLDLTKIYDNDLFNTYKSTTKEPQKPDYVKPVPTPPQPVSVSAPKIEQPKFFDPLPITLTGVFMLHDDSENRAIILDNKLKQEITYKIGDEIEDAQLVKIFSNKILLIRSNGQQEMLYLSQDEATQDMPSHGKKDWSHIVKKVKQDTYLVDKQEFAREVKSLTNVIELFDLTTAYKQGKSIGSKIGKTEKESLASACGFIPGDIITKIKNIPATTTDERLQIYRELIKESEQNVFDVELLRNNALNTIKIRLGIIRPIPKKPPILSTTPIKDQPLRIQKQYDDDLEQEKIKILRQKEKFAPTLRDIRLHEKANILRHQKEVEEKKGALDKDKQ